MKLLMTLTAFVALTSACGPARGSPDRTGRAATAAGLTADAAAGKGVYEANCSGCHGATGQGGRGRSLTPGFNGLTDVEVATVVLNGQGLMAAQAKLTDQQIADLIAHGRATFK